MGHLTETKVAWEMEAEGTSYWVEHAPLVLFSLTGLAESWNKETWGRGEEVDPHEGKAGFL